MTHKYFYQCRILTSVTTDTPRNRALSQNICIRSVSYYVPLLVSEDSSSIWSRDLDLLRFLLEPENLLSSWAITSQGHHKTHPRPVCNGSPLNYLHAVFATTPNLRLTRSHLNLNDSAYLIGRLLKQTNTIFICNGEGRRIFSRQCASTCQVYRVFSNIVSEGNEFNRDSYGFAG